MISPVAHRERQRHRERERETHTHTHRDCDQDREIEAHEKWDPFVRLYSSELDSEYILAGGENEQKSKTCRFCNFA
jgi:hypothetical protein